MYTDSELNNLYSFLRSTGEGNVRKMLVSGPMTENHFRLLLKVVRGCNESDFVQYCNNQSYPKIKMSDAERIIKDNFWPVALKACESVGLIAQSKAA